MPYVLTYKWAVQLYSPDSPQYLIYGLYSYNNYLYMCRTVSHALLSHITYLNINDAIIYALSV